MTVSPQSENPDATPEVGTVKRRRPAFYAVIGAVAALVVIAALARSSRSSLASHASAKEIATVAAAKIVRESLSRQLAFDSELKPFQEVDLHAKVAGYVQSINVDIGDHVKEGDLIATLELPEVEADLDRATASERRAAEEIHRAEAGYDDAKLSLDRLKAIDKAKPNLIAQQEIDTADAREKTAAANLAAAREQAKAAEADVKKLQTMLKYARIVAPFDGVITERYADKGALIQAGTSSSTQAMPLVRLSDNRKLRLVFPVSVSFVAATHRGKPVRVEIPGMHKEINATITRTSQKVSTSTRTMDAEVDLDNDDYSLIPGMYAAVRVDVDTRTNALVIPIEAVSRGKSAATVYAIDSNGVIEERKVTLGIESPDKVEAINGVKEGDLVMIGSRTQVKPGQRVAAKIVEPSMAINAR
jgi:RND family efflux transporter MFP subunit